MAVNVEQLADAIGKAENSWHYKPYGIMRDYCTPQTTSQCRKGCIQTIQKRLAMYEKTGKEEPFIEYLSRSYAPIGASNDPENLNKNWVRNVKWHYEHPTG